LVEALEQFGFASLGLQETDFLQPNQIIQFGNRPYRIELLTTIPGVDFEECYRSRVAITIDGVLVNFIDLESLKKNKKASGRLTDFADLENLQ
jgi:hypothetical protein